MRHRYSRERGSFTLMGACNVDGMIMSACEVFDTQDEAFNTEQFMRWARARLVRNCSVPQRSIY